MSDTIGKDELVAMLRRAVEQVRANHEMLSKLDSFGGDGDHGTTMLRAMALLEEAIEKSAAAHITDLLNDIGWAVMGVDGGATGPLFGMFFLGMSEPAAGKDAIDTALLADMFEAGLASVQQQTKAQVGDKTMVDALVPGVQAMRKATNEGLAIPDACRRAAEAAEQGAKSTEQLKPRFGRAKNVADQSMGHADPGATSVSLVFKGFSEGIQANG